MKLLKKFILISLTMVACLNMYGKPPSAMQLTDEDIRMLESFGLSKDDVQQVVSAVNNLTPEEQMKLAQEGERLTKEMAKSGVNPNDPNQVFDFISKQQPPSGPTPPQRPEPRPSIIEPEFEKPAKEEKPAIKPIPSISSKVVAKMLTELIRNIQLFRQKSFESWKLRRSLEKNNAIFDLFVYYLNVLNTPELIPYLASNEFQNLYSLLERLSEIFSQNISDINRKTTFEEEEIDDPYRTLGLAYDVEIDEITSTYNKLKKKYDPNVLKKTGKYKNLKEAELTFGHIKEAYQSLKNPKEKKIIDKYLKDYYSSVAQDEQISHNAFNGLMGALHQAMQRNLMEMIKKLFDAYAPEKKKLAEEWEKSRKASIENAKKEYEAALSRGKNVRPQFFMPYEEPGERYWREFKIPETQRPFMPSFEFGPRPSSQPMMGPSEPFGPAPKAEAPKKDGGPKGEKDKGKGPEAPSGDKGGGDKSAPSRPSGKPADAPKPVLSLDEQLEVFNLMHNRDLGSLTKGLDATDKLFKIGDVPTYLSEDTSATSKRSPQKTDPALEEVDKLVKKIKLFDIDTDFEELYKKVTDKKLAPEKKAEYKKLWQEVYAKNSKALETLTKITSQVLNPSLTGQNTGRPMHTNKMNHELLDPNNSTHLKQIQDLRKSKAAPQPGQPGYLGYVKATIDDATDKFDKISKALGVEAQKK